MCYILDADKVMFNFFASREEDSITFAEFNALSERIAKECNNGIIVRNYRVLVENTIARYPDVFAMSNQERRIRRIIRSRGKIKSYLSDINRDVPSSVVMAMNRVFE